MRQPRHPPVLKSCPIPKPTTDDPKGRPDSAPDGIGRSRSHSQGHWFRSTGRLTKLNRGISAAQDTCDEDRPNVRISTVDPPCAVVVAERRLEPASPQCSPSVLIGPSNVRPLRHHGLLTLGLNKRIGGISHQCAMELNALCICQLQLCFKM